MLQPTPCGPGHPEQLSPDAIRRARGTYSCRVVGAATNLTIQNESICTTRETLTALAMLILYLPGAQHYETIGYRTARRDTTQFCETFCCRRSRLCRSNLEDQHQRGWFHCISPNIHLMRNVTSFSLSTPSATIMRDQAF